MSKSKLIHYLISLEGFKVLSTIQSKKLNSFKDSFNPTYQELANSLNSNPATKRAEKIENYKLEKSLTTKLEILNDYYKTRKDDDDEDDNEQDEDVFERFDEETIRAIYIDQLKLFSLTSFNMLELIVMESEVLSKRPQHIEQQDRMQVNKGDSRENSKFDSHNEYGYTSKLEKVYNPNAKGAEKMSELITKQGKILQPFTITSSRKDLQKKVFGTGQVLPSMSVEEYLDYELANGKMMKEEVKDPDKDEDATDNSDEEMEKRNWDDWKDENPKGMGNTGGNLG